MEDSTCQHQSAHLFSCFNVWLNAIALEFDKFIEQGAKPHYNSNLKLLKKLYAFSWTCLRGWICWTIPPTITEINYFIRNTKIIKYAKI